MVDGYIQNIFCTLCCLDKALITLFVRASFFFCVLQLCHLGRQSGSAVSVLCRPQCAWEKVRVKGALIVLGLLDNGARVLRLFAPLVGVLLQFFILLSQCFHLIDHLAIVRVVVGRLRKDTLLFCS